MIRVIKLAVFNYLAIVFFTVIYYNMQHGSFSKIGKPNVSPSLTDIFSYTTSIQAGVGLPDISCESQSAKLAVTIQQLVMIMSNIFIIYVFTQL